MIAVFFGPPGSGKGTQAAIMAKRLGLAHISTGEMFRAEVAAQTELGKEVEHLMAGGSLVPDELTIRVLEARLQQPDCRGGALLDGFPRTVAQAKALDEMLQHRGNGISVVINLRVPEATLRERIAARQELDHRSDDTQDAFTNRMAVYHEQTEPILDYYAEGTTRVENIDGVGEIEEIARRILDKVDALDGEVAL